MKIKDFNIFYEIVQRVIDVQRDKSITYQISQLVSEMEQMVFINEQHAIEYFNTTCIESLSVNPFVGVEPKNDLPFICTLRLLETQVVSRTGYDARYGVVKPDGNQGRTIREKFVFNKSSDYIELLDGQPCNEWGDIDPEQITPNGIKKHICNRIKKMFLENFVVDFDSEDKFLVTFADDTNITINLSVAHGNTPTTLATIELIYPTKNHDYLEVEMKIIWVNCSNNSVKDTVNNTLLGNILLVWNKIDYGVIKHIYDAYKRIV